MPDPDVTWGIWLGLAAFAFAVFETWALLARRAGKDPATLTGTLRRWLGIQPQRRRRYLLGTALLVFLVWFAGHILAGWPP